MPDPQNPWWLLLVSLLSGLAGALIQAAWTWFRRPKLVVSFSPFDVGMIVDSPAWSGLRIGQMRTLRLRVENRGLTSAHKVHASMIELVMFSLGRSSPSYLIDEVLELRLALSDQAFFDLAPKGYRWIDVAYLDVFEEVGPSLRFGIVSAVPGRMALMGFRRTGSLLCRRDCIRRGCGGAAPHAHPLGMGWFCWRP